MAESLPVALPMQPLANSGLCVTVNSQKPSATHAHQNKKKPQTKKTTPNPRNQTTHHRNAATPKGVRQVFPQRMVAADRTCLLLLQNQQEEK